MILGPWAKLFVIEQNLKKDEFDGIFKSFQDQTVKQMTIIPLRDEVSSTPEQSLVQSFATSASSSLLSIRKFSAV